VYNFAGSYFSSWAKFQGTCFESRCPIRGLSDLDSATISEFELPNSMWFLSQAISSQHRDLTATENQELSFGTATKPKRGFGTALA
jgi:hypothetical protein